MSDTVHVVNDNGRGRLLRLLMHPRTLIIGAVAILIVAAGVIGFSLMSHRKSPGVAKVLEQTNDINNKGDYDAKISALTASLNQTQNKDQKLEIYRALAATAASKGQSGLALDYLAARHKLDPATADIDAEMMGTLYEAAKQYSKAIEQYKQAVTYQKSLSDYSKRAQHVRSLEAHIQELETML